MQWNLGLDADLYQAGSTDTSTPPRFSQEWLGSWHWSELAAGAPKDVMQLRRRKKWGNKVWNHRQWDWSQFWSDMAICDLQQLGTMPDLLGCSVNIGWLNELTKNTDQGEIWTQGSKALLPSLSIHQTPYQKSEFPLQYLGLAFQLPSTASSSEPLEYCLGSINFPLIFSHTPQLITWCCLVRTFSPCNINLRKEHLWATFLKGQAPSLMFGPGMRWVTPSLVDVRLSKGQVAGHLAAPIAHGWARSLAGHTGCSWRLQPLCGLPSHLPQQKGWRFSNSTGMTHSRKYILQSDPVSICVYCTPSSSDTDFFSHFNLLEIWMSLINSDILPLIGSNFSFWVVHRILCLPIDYDFDSVKYGICITEKILLIFTTWCPMIFSMFFSISSHFLLMLII